jgi:hypothetical protein
MRLECLWLLLSGPANPSNSHGIIHPVPGGPKKHGTIAMWHAPLRREMNAPRTELGHRGKKYRSVLWYTAFRKEHD